VNASAPLGPIHWPDAGLGRAATAGVVAGSAGGVMLLVYLASRVWAARMG
jgi:hypothetical protein